MNRAAALGTLVLLAACSGRDRPIDEPDGGCGPDTPALRIVCPSTIDLGCVAASGSTALCGLT